MILLVCNLAILPNLWVMADVIANFFLVVSHVETTFWPLNVILWQMFCHCGDSLCCGWCCATVVDETTFVMTDVIVIFNGINHFLKCFCYIRYNSYLMWMADVIAIVADVVATIAIYFIVVDVITTCCWLMSLPNMWWLMLLPSVADRMATLCDGLMLLPCGRWNNHMVGM